MPLQGYLRDFADGLLAQTRVSLWRALLVWGRLRSIGWPGIRPAAGNGRAFVVPPGSAVKETMYSPNAPTRTNVRGDGEGMEKTVGRLAHFTDVESSREKGRNTFLVAPRGQGTIRGLHAHPPRRRERNARRRDSSTQHTSAATSAGSGEINREARRCYQWEVVNSPVPRARECSVLVA